MALTADQVTQMQHVATTAVKAAIDAATAASRLNPATLPTKKPSIFRYDFDDIDEYIVVWENFAKVKNIIPEERLPTFLTYLDPSAQQKLQAVDFEEKTWAQALVVIRETLENRMSKMEAKQLMTNAKQNDTETPREFGFRVEKLSKKAYSDNQVVRDENLSDCFIRGLNSDFAALKLLSDHQDGQTFKDKIKSAQEMYIAAKVRKTNKGDEQIFSVDQNRECRNSSANMESLLKEHFKCLQNITAASSINSKEVPKQNDEMVNLTTLMKEQTEAIKALGVNQVQFQKDFQRRPPMNFNNRGAPPQRTMNPCTFCSRNNHPSRFCRYNPHNERYNPRMISHPGNTRPVHGYYNNNQQYRNPTRNYNSYGATNPTYTTPTVQPHQPSTQQTAQYIPQQQQQTYNNQNMQHESSNEKSNSYQQNFLNYRPSNQ